MDSHGWIIMAGTLESSPCCTTVVVSEAFADLDAVAMDYNTKYNHSLYGLTW